MRSPPCYFLFWSYFLFLAHTCTSTGAHAKGQDHKRDHTSDLGHMKQCRRQERLRWHPWSAKPLAGCVVPTDNDPGGYWWPPAYSTYGPTIVSFIFFTTYYFQQFFGSWTSEAILKPQTEIICRSYVPGKLKHQFTQTRPIFLALHLLGLGFWMFRVLHCFSIINRPQAPL